MPTAEAVIFDVGNVLYGWDPHSFLEEHIPEENARLEFLEQANFFAWHESLDAGRPFADASKQLSSLFPA